MRVFSGLRPSWYGELSRSDDSRDGVNTEHAQGRVNETYPHRRHTGGPPVRRNLEAGVDDASPSQGADGPGRQPEIQNQFDSGAVSPDRVGGCPDARPMNQCDASRPFDHPVQMGQVQSPGEMSAEYGYGDNLAAWQGGVTNLGAMMGPSAMGWGDPRYGRPNAPCRGILNDGNEDVSRSWETGVMRTQPETLNQFDSGASSHNNWIPDDNKSPKHETLMGPLNQKGNESESESRCDSPASVSGHVQIADVAASGAEAVAKATDSGCEAPTKVSWSSHVPLAGVDEDTVNSTADAIPHVELHRNGVVTLVQDVGDMNEKIELLLRQMKLFLSEQSKQGRARKRSINMQNVTCFRCQQVGHFARKCPRK